MMQNKQDVVRILLLICDDARFFGAIKTIVTKNASRISSFFAFLSIYFDTLARPLSQKTRSYPIERARSFSRTICGSVELT
jgi:hypothetical protein